ncbi:HRDC domain-containing protein [Anaerolineales bacterium HSG6]|nr:HRDC domain-containing protein [Anaerolineales bacterium HSG6]MDM8531197.1 HRDC domain-containing protein [Anaerolineales bacterium HSG25]
MFKKTVESPPIWVDTPAQLNKLINKIMKEPVVAVDTESDSLYSYFEKVCLIQFSIPSADYLVDPLNVDVTDLESFFSDFSIQKVFHAVEYDITCLKRDFDFSINNLFDTMLAARLLGWERHGLAAILEREFSVKSDKRFQKYNWGERPLSPQAFNYARMDTHFLISIRNIQSNQLKRKELTHLASDAFERATHSRTTAKVFNPDDFWRVKGARHIQPSEQSILRELFILRDKIAQQLDRPHFKVMNDFVLINLAKQQPQHVNELFDFKGLNIKICRYHGAKIIKAIQIGQRNSPPLDPHYDRRHRPNPKMMSRYERLRHWRNSLSEGKGVAADIIIDNHSLMEIARHDPTSLENLFDIEELTDWQVKNYGEQLLKAIGVQFTG